MVDFISRVSFDEIVGYWLDQEYRNRTDMRSFLDLHFKDVVPFIGNGNYSDPLANQQRFRGLNAIRSGILQRLPSKIDWWFAKIKDEDTSQLILINSGDWRALTDGTLKPLHAARRIASDPELRMGTYGKQVSFILTHYKEWEDAQASLILVGPKEGPLTIIDGVHRTVGFFLYHCVEEHGPMAPRPVYLGVTEKPWNFSFN